MPKFRFIVQSATGKVRRGTLTEADSEAARRRLEQAGFAVTSLIEEVELVIEAPPGGDGRPKLIHKRASIIAFEETWWERLWRLFHTYFLRREAALVLAATGLVWMVVGLAGGPQNSDPPELEYSGYKIQVITDEQDYAAKTMVVRLPDIPFKATRAVDAQGQVEIDFEAAVAPHRIEVVLMEEDQVEARASGLLLDKGEGRLEFRPELKRASKG